MVSDATRNRVWTSLIEAQTRSVYFGRVASRMHTQERWAALLVAVFSTAAFVALVSKLQIPYVGETATLLSALAGGYVAMLQRNKTAAALCSIARTWGEVQDEYDRLWLQLGGIEDATAIERWRKIETKHYNADETAPALGLVSRRLLRACQIQVMELRGLKIDGSS